MSSSLEVLEAEALQLPEVDRARLIERLIASLDTDPKVENAWAEEVERRLAAIENGTAAWLTGPETLNEIKAQYR